MSLTVSVMAVNVMASPPSQLVKIRLLLRKNGKIVQAISPTNKQFVLPRSAEGSEYELEIRNRSPARISVIVAIDGISILGKKTIDESKSLGSAGGYIVGPYRTVRIRGWRMNNKSVQSFKITSPKNSVAEKQGAPTGIGRIDMLAFAEKPVAIDPVWRPKGPGWPNSPGWPNINRNIRANQARVGTGSGKTVNDASKRVKFKRGRVIANSRFRYHLQTAGSKSE